MISQFTKEGNHPTLSNLIFQFPKDVYPVGRLDSDSEGLLLLTNDKSINNKLLNPKFGHNRTYLAQVENIFSKEAMLKLEKGVTISVDGKSYKTLPCQTELMNDEFNLPDRTPPIRFRKHIPTSIIKITLQEGKNRQVRKMTAAVGFPTLRLIRIAIEKLELGDLKSGEVKEIKDNEIDTLLHL